MNAEMMDFDRAFQFDHIKRINPMNMSVPHWHNHYEIYYLVSGERKYFIENRIFTVKPGDVILIPKEVLHKTTAISSNEHERIVMNASEEWIPAEVRPCFTHYCLHAPPSQKAYIEDILRRIEQEFRAMDTFGMKLTRQYLFELLVLLTRLAQTPTALGSCERQDTAMEKAAQYICKHYRAPLTLPTMAREFSMNKEYFSKKFKQDTGFGFNEYLNQVRVANAVKLLNSTDLCITEIAYRCGFNDSNYFATVFKKIKGVNPKKYKSSGRCD